MANGRHTKRVMDENSTKPQTGMSYEDKGAVYSITIDILDHIARKPKYVNLILSDKSDPVKGR